MDANEARVREVWEKVGGYDCASLGLDCGVHIFYQGKCLHHFGGFTHAAAAWSAAAAYTETVLEEARQMREEIARFDEVEVSPDEWRAWAHERAPGADQDYVRESIIGHFRDCRVVARLEAIYAAHIRGIKPEALERMGQ